MIENFFNPIFVIVLALVAGMTLAWALFSKTKRPAQLAMWFGILHAAFVGCLAIFILVESRRNDMVGFLWMVAFVVDQPVSLAFQLIEHMTPGALSEIPLPFLFFSVVGSAQYVLLGWALGHGIRRIRQRAFAKQNF